MKDIMSSDEVKELFNSISGKFDEYGLIGNSGFVAPGHHIHASYSCNGMIFVKDGDWWKRMKAEDITNEEIIKCTYCNTPAVRLDHCWPGITNETTCKEHLDEYKKRLKRRKDDN